MKQNTQIIFLGIFTLLFLLPTCIVHYNYYKFSKGYIFSFESDFIKRQGINDILILNKNDIEDITFFMTPNRILRSGLINFPIENYYYGKIKMKSGKSIIITCLFSNKLDDILAETYSGVKIKKIKSYIPLIKV